MAGRKLWGSSKTLFSPAADPPPCSIADSTFLIHPTIPTDSYNWNNNFHGNGAQRVDTTLVVDSKLNYDHQEISGSSHGQQNNPCDFVFLSDQPYNYNQSPFNFCDNVITTSYQELSNGYTPTLLHKSLEQSKQFLGDNGIVNNCCSSTNSYELLSCRSMFETRLLQPPALSFSNIVRPKCSNLTKMINCGEVVQDLSRVVRENKSREIAIIKRPRSDMSSKLPTFKVRKEKLGDKIAMLQQLVSPFGKTDTASVLHEAIQYIKFLHDQIRVLSAPYMEVEENDQEQQQIKEELKDMKEDKKQDLRSGGLCLVGISSAVALTNGNTFDFWSPTFGGTFR